MPHVTSTQHCPRVWSQHKALFLKLDSSHNPMFQVPCMYQLILGHTCRVGHGYSLLTLSSMQKLILFQNGGSGLQKATSSFCVLHTDTAHPAPSCETMELTVGMGQTGLGMRQA
jgi:hypothetical protein